MMYAKKSPNGKENQSSVCEIDWGQNPYAPPEVTQCFPDVGQTWGAHKQEHHGVGELRHGHAHVDQEQGEQPQRPQQQHLAPGVLEGPVLVTDCKA